MKETDLAARVIDYLRDLKYEVHQEVCGADIVGLFDGRTWIIECKLGLGLGVLSQADEWARRGSAFYVSVATPYLKYGPARTFAERLMRERGIGWLRVGLQDGHSQYDYPVTEVIPPRLQRTAAKRAKRRGLDNIGSLLNEHTASGYAIAGSPSPRSWTPFKQTCRNVLAQLHAASEPLTCRQIVDRIEHHYSSKSSARSRLHHHLATGVIEGVASVGGHPSRWAIAARAPV